MSYPRTFILPFQKTEIEGPLRLRRERPANRKGYPPKNLSDPLSFKDSSKLEMSFVGANCAEP